MTKPTASKTSPGSSDLFDRQMTALRAEEAARAAELAQVSEDLERLRAAAARRAQRKPTQLERWRTDTPAMAEARRKLAERPLVYTGVPYWMPGPAVVTRKWLRAQARFGWALLAWLLIGNGALVWYLATHAHR